ELTVIVAGGGGGVVVCPVARAMITDFAGRIIVVIPFGPTVGAGGLRSSWSTSRVLPAGGLGVLFPPRPRRLAGVDITSTVSAPIVRRNANGPGVATLSNTTSTGPCVSAAFPLRRSASFFRR